MPSSPATASRRHRFESLYTFEVEKTFLRRRLCSIEIQTPVDTGLNDFQNVDGTTNGNEGTVFGNIALTLKCLVYQAASAWASPSARWSMCPPRRMAGSISEAKPC